MNERIEKLYEQSRIGPGLGYDIEKFAELIVLECASIDFRNESCGAFSGDQDFLISKLIRKHFGVES